jgi:hypothetical protein
MVTQTPFQGALLLQRKLTQLSHPDHTLITYPNLGMNFIHHLDGLLNKDLYQNMSWHTFTHGLNLDQACLGTSSK